jgi:peptide/nickel transport system substrate-binding protein
MLPSTSRSVRYAAVAATLTVLSLVGFTKPGGPQPSVAGGPVYGGTLRLVAASGPDYLDTVPAYYNADYILERAYARQLVSYPSLADPSAYSSGWKKDTTPAADVAKAVPTVANGGITDGEKTYTFHIRAGVNWDTNPPRQVTAADFVREFKAFCNPAPGGFVGNLSYYSATIVGLGSYCNSETAYFANPQHPVTAANVAKFQNTHTIAGVTAVNSLTLRFRLFHPASDFLYMLTLPFASARPVEYDKYLPNSLQLDEHTISDGPYQITSYRPGRSIVLQRNPAWRQDTDPLRHQYVNKITVTLGVPDASTQVADLRAAKYDLMLDTTVPTNAIHSLRSDRDFHIWPGNNLLPYVVFNLRSPNSRHAIARLDVRRAIEYGIDKVSVQNVMGGAAAAPVLNSVIPPGNLGHFSGNPYPDRGGRGNSARCRALLAKAGFSRGLKLRYWYLSDSMNTEVFQVIQASLHRCGITLIGKPLPGSEFFVDLGNAPVNNLPGTFDMASAGWIPDWFGNSGRTFIDPLFRTNCVINSNNYGCYNSLRVDRLMTAAEDATTLKAAATFWRQANAQIMKDAPIVPLVDGQNPIYASPRVHEAGLAHGVVYLPVIGGPDVTNVWIKKA